MVEGCVKMLNSVFAAFLVVKDQFVSSKPMEWTLGPFL